MQHFAHQNTHAVYTSCSREAAKNLLFVSLIPPKTSTGAQSITSVSSGLQGLGPTESSRIPQQIPQAWFAGPSIFLQLKNSHLLDCRAP
jgi:hypothetical protein